MSPKSAQTFQKELEFLQLAMAGRVERLPSFRGVEGRKTGLAGDGADASTSSRRINAESSDTHRKACDDSTCCKEEHACETNALEELEADRLAPFECNICFELANDAVITLCGHMYCWNCLYR